MSDASRKVKNPLLSAAGVSFPFEDFSSSALLMPVTPATSSVLQDEGEIASFVGHQQQQQQQQPAVSSNQKEFNVAFPTQPEHHQQIARNSEQHQLPRNNLPQNAPADSEIYLPPINDHRELTTSEYQPQKQGYLSSLLSSLPNISLASITGDREDSPSGRNSVKDTNPGSSDYNPIHQQPLYGPPIGHSAASYNPGGGGPQTNIYEIGSTNSIPWNQPDNITRGSSSPFTSTPPPPTVQPPPIALPPTGGPPSSYRLGGQRRLKYAPPPDLTTSSPRVVTGIPPSAPSFSPAPSVLYPQAPPPVATGQNSVSLVQEPLKNYSLVVGQQATQTLPQSIPPRIYPAEEPRLEPATPQNTPANPTPFSILTPPVQGRDFGHTPVGAIPRTTAEDLLQEIDLRESLSAPPAPVASAPEAEELPEIKNDAPASRFAPISAERVSEKLEHLLTERKEELSPKVLVEAGSFDPGQTSRETSSLGKPPPPSTEEGKSTAAYFASPASDNRGSGISEFYDPTKFAGEIFTPRTTKAQNFTPAFYDPSKFSATSVHPIPQPQPYQQPKQQSYSQLENFAPVYNPQSFFYPSDKATPPRQEPAAYFNPPSPPMAVAAPEPTGSATLDPIQMSINPLGSSGYSYNSENGLQNLPPSLHNLAAGTSSSKQTMPYRPVYQHWFHRKEVETKVLWIPFSMQDSLNLEEVHNSTEITPETIVATDGGRYDVDILRRLRTPVYWSGTPNEVRRCSWFYKGPAESRYVPYEESVAARLEEEYQQACTTNSWNKRIELSNGEYIIFHSATVQVHYLQTGSPEMSTSWGNNAGAAARPRVVKRGVDEFDIDEGEPEQVDHLLFLVHGIGSVCDLKFRSVEEVVDEFRGISLQLVQSHYRTASEQGTVNKIEVLPISWHTTLHSDDTGIDKKLQAITLESIPKLRHFTNDTLSDILFYTSPIYCQTIMQTVGNEMNRLHALFKKRNPTFTGGVYLGGHSLGSLILFDLLCHQKPPKEEEEELIESLEEEREPGSAESLNEEAVRPLRELKTPKIKRRLSRKISYVMGAAGTGQPYINYPQLNFNPGAFFALGSPIGMFVTVRGIDTLGEDFALPTCPAFFNIFHPFDPVAYRVEALINPDAKRYRPKLIPHHKGRKRMHLELKETMARVGADLKQKLLDSVRSTWNSVYQLAMFHKSDNHTLELEIDKVVEEQLHGASANEEPESAQLQNDDSGDEVAIGKLNGGRRVDYVLQEAPFEYINEYIFALTSHVCYWESEDTMLMMLKEIYGSMGIQSDAQQPQQTLTIERASPSPVMPQANTSTAYSNSGPTYGTSSGGPPLRFEDKSPAAVQIGMDPTAPISEKPLGPPPTSGFMRKS